MSRKRDVERLAAQQQSEARRKGSAHRSLVKRTDKRKTADAEASIGEALGPVDGETPADAEAPTDTVVFARVPEFLRESEEIDVDADVPGDATDAGADAGTDPDTDGGVGPSAGDDAGAAAPNLNLDPESESMGAELAGEVEPSVTEPPAAFNLPEDTEPPYEPAYTPESDQEETMVMEPIVAADPSPDDQASAPLSQDATPLNQSESRTFAATATAEPAEIAEPAESSPQRTKRRRWPWVLLVVLLVIAAAYYGAATYFGARVPADTLALGVDISGQEAGAATEALNEAASTMEAEPFTLTVDGAQTTVGPSEAGLSIDTTAMINEATGFTLNPISLFGRHTGSTQLEPVVIVDDAALDAAMNSASVQLDQASTDASVSIVGTTATTVPGSPSLTVDHDDTAARISAEWPTQTQIEAVATVAEADVPDHEADRTVQTLNETVLASAATLTGPNGDAVLEPEKFAPFLATTPAGSRLEIVADGKGLSAMMRGADPALENEPIDATLSFDKAHKLVTTDSEPGRALDDSKMGEALIEATTAIDHTGPIAYREVYPKVSTEDLGIADLKEVVSSFSTPLTAEPIRTKNLARGAEKVTGIVIMPNDNFDLTDALTPITREDGFYPAHVIVDGILTDGIGGGLSQMSTTTYNAGYFAGYEDITHRPHSKYFKRYPAGRESTIYTGQINMVFKNNTPYAAVMSSYVANNRLYVDIWSTPYFTVKTAASPRTNVVQPKTVKLDRADCEPSGGGGAGFTISNTRTVYLEGKEVDKTTNTWTYLPDNQIECE